MLKKILPLESFNNCNCTSHYHLYSCVDMLALLWKNGMIMRQKFLAGADGALSTNLKNKNTTLLDRY